MKVEPPMWSVDVFVLLQSLLKFHKLLMGDEVGLRREYYVRAVRQSSELETKLSQPGRKLWVLLREMFLRQQPLSS